MSKNNQQYPMPCPKCRKIIDAREQICPYCGVDTDAMLWSWRIGFSLLAVTFVLGCGALAGYLFGWDYFIVSWILGLGLGLVLAWRMG